MEKKAKIALAVIKKVYDNFPETQEFIDKAYIEKCCKENISVDEVFFSINNDCQFFLVLCCYASLRFVMKYVIFFYILQALDLSNKEKEKKNVEEIKKELLELIIKEKLEDLELINKADNNLTLQDALECVKQYEKHLQNEKSKIISIAYKQGQILNQFKESKKFINILVKRLKMSKSTITFKINLYKLLKKYPLFPQINLICRINGDQFENILMD